MLKDSRHTRCVLNFKYIYYEYFKTNLQKTIMVKSGNS